MRGENQRFFDLLESDQSDPQVQYELGQCYLTGDGVEQNGAEAEKWLRRAADQGHEEAAALLAGAAANAPDALPPLDEDTLPDWCLEAEEGDMEAQFQVACYFLEHGSEIERGDAERYLIMATKQGHPRACLLLARQRLERGQTDGVAELLCNAADCGLWEAAELLGECCSQGTGMDRNPQEAERRFIQAAEWGGGKQMLRLALRYAEGDQVSVSRGRAFSWIKKARENGLPDAKEQFDLQYAQYLEEQQRLAQEEAERRAQEEAERQRLAQEEAERRAQEEAERQRLAQEEAERRAQEEAERQRLAQEEAERRAQEEAERQRQAQEEAQRQAAAQEKRNAGARSAAFWIGAALLVYAGICCLYQLLSVFSVPQPAFLRGLFYGFVSEDTFLRSLQFKGLPGLCCVGWYVLSSSGRQVKRSSLIFGGLLAAQAIYFLVSLKQSAGSWFGMVFLGVFRLALYLIASAATFYVLFSAAAFFLNTVLGGKISWPLYDKIIGIIKQKLDISS